MIYDGLRFKEKSPLLEYLLGSDAQLSFLAAQWRICGAPKFNVEPTDSVQHSSS